ncbi:MAG TPA: hypothetical protein VD867_16495 [Burkholderiales bacterium]|nr:hypothetical protein [Burkholderiales bacterium]
MMRLAGLLLLSISLSASAANNDPAANAKADATLKPGVYSGSLQEEGGTRTANVKITLKDITSDGRVTARVQSSHTRKSCTKALPLNGLVLPDGGMRLDVSSGAPEACARIYTVRMDPAGTVAGTFTDGTKQRAKKSAAAK